MTRSFKILSIVTASVVVVLTIADVILSVNGLPTWSQVISYWSDPAPIIPWCWGGLGGHFFARDPIPRIENRIEGIVILLVISAVVSFGPHGIPLFYFFLAAPVWGITWRA